MNLKRKKPWLSERNKTHGLSIGANGKKTRLYSIWIRMKQRCSDLNSSDFNEYGGRGITVCDEWAKYEKFHKWAMSNGYKENLTIERKDNDGDYVPLNCCWASRSEQSKNKRNNHLISFHGETKILMDWSRELGVDQSLLRYRIKNWGVERAFTTPIRGR